MLFPRKYHERVMGGSSGKEDGESKTYQASHLDAQTVTLNSQGDTNLLGSQIKGNTVNANVGGKLNIESLQDEERFKTKSSGGGLEGEFGFGNNWSLSGYGNASKGTTHRKQVNEQAGIFAEDGGYHINADSVHLKGGAIASTNPTNSKLATNKLTFEDIQNESSSSAASASVSGSLKESKEKWVDNETGSAVKPNTENSTKLDSQRSGGISPGLPMFERDSDSSVTRATLTEGTIILNKDTHPTVTTVKELGINTDLAQANNQVAQTKDVKAQLQGQQQIATAIGNVKSAVDTYTSNKQEEAEQEVRRLESQKQRAIAQGNAEALIQINRDLNSAKEAARDWGTSGSYKRIADTVTNVLTSAIAGAPTEAIATTAVSPWVNQEIKRLTTDKTTGEVDKTTNAIAHAVWGAIEAAATKGNVTAGAIAGASSELAAPLIAKALYGTDDPKQLTEVQKQNIVNLSSLAGAIGAGIANGNGSGTEVLTSANQGAEIGKRAVENNYVMAIARGSALVCSRACIQAIEAGLGISLGVALTADEEKAAFLAGMSQDPEKISRLSKEQVDYLNRQILSKGLLFDNSSILGSHVWIPNTDGGFTPIDPSLVTTTYGGKQSIDPRIFVNHTGGVEYPADYNLPTHTGGNQTVTNDKGSHILVGGESQIGDWRDGVLLENADQKYYPNPKLGDITGISGLKPAKPKTPVQGGGKLRARWKDSDGKIYEWDSQHGELEKYDKRGKHLGAFDYKTGDKIKPADPKRRIEP